MSAPLDHLLTEIRACRLCAQHLPHGPRPVLQASASARLLIVGQAPGTRVHASGVPWDDRSGERLRGWMQIVTDAFYDPARVAIVPVGFCYPGRAASGDAPPRPECRATWHPRLMPLLPQVGTALLVGQHAQAWFLGAGRRETLTATVRAWRAYFPRALPLPHPSPRNVAWFKANPWFEAEVLPSLRERVRELVN
ncbi:MAG: uracil-DNA glycosylase family protein [Pseudomonadota bacterium]|nr:uracil-DNA glycosylase family protein [Pseudomonadota bacterium]